jgi:hypothetical protein
MIAARRNPMSGERQRLLSAACAAVLLFGAGQASAQQGGGGGSGGGGSNAQPGCRLVVESGPDQWVLNYNPFSDTTASREFDLAIVNRGTGPCTAVAGVDLRGETFGLTQGGAGDRLTYALIDERGGTDLTPRAGESSRRVGSRPVNLTPGERAPLRFSLTVSSSELLSAGLFSQAAFITLEHPNGTPLAEKPVTLGVRVASAAMMGLKGEFQRNAGVATIDLGVLSQGTRSLNTTLYVLSTAGYRVSVSSANAGRLRQGTTDWYLPYSLVVGERPVDLSAVRSVDVVSTRARQDDYPLSISLPSTAGMRAGDYSDVIRFTVAAL